MARLALVMLLLANVGYFAWSKGWLHDAGLAPEQQSEPQRVAEQIRPEALRIVARADDADGETAKAPTARRPAAAACMQAGPFDEAQAAALETALAHLLAGSRWRLEPAQREAQWLTLDVDAALLGKLPALEAALAGKALGPCDPASPR